jgi:hypothetical protein
MKETLKLTVKFNFREFQPSGLANLMAFMAQIHAKIKSAKIIIFIDIL